MAKAVIAAFLSILFYLTNLLGGAQQQPVSAPADQYSYSVLGQRGQIAADRAILRSSPHTQSSVTGTVEQNEILLILDEQADWYKVRVIPQTEGWLPKYAVNLAPPERTKARKIVLGYFSEDPNAYESLLTHGSHLTGIVPLGWRLTSEGKLLNEFAPEQIGRGLYFAGNQKMATYAHLQLPSASDPFFSIPRLWPASFAAIEDAIAEWGLRGVLLDLDHIPGADRGGLFAYAADLRAQLRAEGLPSLLALPWDEKLDWSAAADAADLLVIKTGDLSATTPGALASTEHLGDVLTRLVERVAAEKIILGMFNIGLDWAGTGQPTPLSHEQVLELAARTGADIKWDSQSQTPYFRYGDNHEVWFENRYSIKHKLELAEKFDLAGVAFLQLGQEDRDIWNVLAATF